MGNDLNFNKILDELKLIHERYPDLRFGQVIQIAMDISKRRPNTDLNDYTSKHILKCLKEFHDNLKNNRKHGIQMDSVAKYSRMHNKFIETKTEFIEKLQTIKGVSEKAAKQISEDYSSEQTLINVIKCKVPLVIKDDKIKNIVTKHYEDLLNKEEN